MSVFFLFLLATSFGCVSTLFWVPEEDMGRGYFQMNALIVLGLLGLAVAVLVLYPFQPFGTRATAGRIAVTTAPFCWHRPSSLHWRQLSPTGCF
jgi:hypothetical protein